MARKPGLWVSTVGIIRATSGVIVADSATLSDANYPVTNAFDASGFDTIMVGVEILGGASPTATIEFLFRDGDAADQSRWFRMQFGARNGITAIASSVSEDTGALAPAAGAVNFVEMHTFGQKLVYARIKAVTNSGSTTGLNVLAVGGYARDMINLHRN